MEHCIDQGFAEGYARIALIGSDAPQIPMLRIRRVFEYLKEAPIVIGPDKGGGVVFDRLFPSFGNHEKKASSGARDRICKQSSTVVAARQLLTNFFLWK